MAARKKAKKRTKRKKVARKKTGKKKRTTRKKVTKRRTKKKATKRKTTRKKARKKATKRKTTRKKATKRKTAKKKVRRKKRKPSAAFMRALTPSADLAAIVGSKPLPRTEVVKKLWKYIKRLDLQDRINRRVIVADAKLLKVFGGKSKVDMFQMTKLVSKHLK